jgi:class 3 adenylate cyclase
MSDASAVSGGTASPESRPAARTAFVGRVRERAELRAALDGALAGRGGVVLLAGEAGIGKTRLADELAGEAAVRGAAVAWGRCWEGGGAPAYWPWIQILRASLRDGAPGAEAAWPAGSPLAALLRPELHPDLGNSAGETTEGTGFEAADPLDERFRLFDAVAAFLRALSRTRPLVLVFDDGHAADSASLSMLRFVARDLRQLPVLIVVTYREAEARLQPGLSNDIAELGREGTTLTLRGLNEAEVARLIEDSAGRAAGRDTVETLHQITEGNPFYLVEILRLLIAAGQIPSSSDVGLTRLEIPDSVRNAIRRRLGLVSEATRKVLGVAAVVGREFDLRVLRGAARIEDEPLALALEEAETNGIIARSDQAVTRYQFCHALIPETLYHDMPQAARRGIHLRTGDALAEVHGAHLEPHLAEQAHHYASAMPAAPVTKVVETARRAAAHAHAMLAYQEAAHLYEVALAAVEIAPLPDAELRCLLSLGLGESLYGAGLFERSRAAFSKAADTARELGRSEWLARAALGFGMPPQSPYSVDEAAVRLLEESLAALPAADSALRAMSLARLGAELYWSETRGQGADLSAQALEMARRVGDDRTLIHVLYTRHVAAWSVDNLDERLALATEIVELAAEPDNRVWATRVWGLRAHYLRFTDLLERGDIAGVDEEIERYARLAVELRQHLGYEQLARATRALMSARFDEAERLGHEALAVAQRLERRTRAFRQAVNSHLLILRREQRRLEELRPIFASARRAPSPALARASLALCLVELGRSEEAAAEFEQLAAGEFDSVPRDSGWMATMVLLAEVCASLHDSERAAILYRLLRPYAARNATLDIHVCYGSVSHYLGMLATVMGDFDLAEGHFEVALEFNERMGATLWVSHTRYQRARMLLARDHGEDRRDAAALAERTLAVVESAGLANLIGKLRSLLRATVEPGTAVTILFTDIQDSTGLTERLGDARAQDLIRVHNALVREQVARHGGVEVKSLGDGFMIAFSEASIALRCAIGIQRAIALQGEHHPEAPLSVAIGIHAGEAIRDRGDFHGRTVILAARIRSQARGGEILVSATVQGVTAGDVVYNEGRDVELKGFAGSHRLYSVDWS